MVATAARLAIVQESMLEACGADVLKAGRFILHCKIFVVPENIAALALVLVNDSLLG